MGQELMEADGLPEFFVDGFCDYQVIGGILRATGYRIRHTDQGEERVPQLRLVVSQSGVDEVKRRASYKRDGTGRLSRMVIKEGEKPN